MCMGILTAYMILYYMLPAAHGDQKRASGPLNCSYRQLQVSMWVLRIEHGSSGLAVSSNY